MESLKQLVFFLLVLAALSALGLLVVTSLAVVVAVLAPLLGAGYAALRMKVAQALWRSRGRFPLPGAGVRLIGERRARALAGLEVLSGVSALLLSLTPAVLVFGPREALVVLLAGGLGGVLTSGAMRRRLISGSQPVDVLPPE